MQLESDIFQKGSELDMNPSRINQD